MCNTRIFFWKQIKIQKLYHMVFWEISEISEIHLAISQKLLVRRKTLDHFIFVAMTPLFNFHILQLFWKCFLKRLTAKNTWNFVITFLRSYFQRFHILWPFCVVNSSEGAFKKSGKFKNLKHLRFLCEFKPKKTPSFLIGFAPMKFVSIDYVQIYCDFRLEIKCL